MSYLGRKPNSLATGIESVCLSRLMKFFRTSGRLSVNDVAAGLPSSWAKTGCFSEGIALGTRPVGLHMVLVRMTAFVGRLVGNL